MRFEIAANRWRFEALRTTNRDSRHLTSEQRRNFTSLIDLLMGLFRGAVFCHGGGARKQPIKQPTKMPTSTMVLMGRFPSLMGRFPTLMGRFPDVVLTGHSTSCTGKQPIKKRGIKSFLNLRNSKRINSVIVSGTGGIQLFGASPLVS